jgi:hypothetical protein
LAAQGLSEAALTMKNIADVLDSSMVDANGKAIRRGIDLYVLGQIMNNRNSIDYADQGEGTPNSFRLLGIATITEDLLNLEGITFWPTPIRPDQLTYLENQKYYRPPKILLQPGPKADMRPGRMAVRGAA